MPEDPLPCPELWDAALMAEAYHPCTVDYFGEKVSLDNVRSPEDVVKIGKRPDGIPEDVALVYADRVVGEFIDWRKARLEMDKQPVRLR
ncbi:hypothetical protein K466DRAFT_607453 [Polyporus arcularius HHB13444]|uniref:Uncharacterized protein n=1 Tax=Polyporus arcularius HHB13444 TaxID=1314778 RepID=A0A5C3NWU9_9APHY|nr:hypothetical protein K466DRAFT_607453 [Polyporus arcularius HHB13444]